MAKAATAELSEECKLPFEKKAEKADAVFIASLREAIDQFTGIYEVKTVFKGNILPSQKAILVDQGHRVLLDQNPVGKTKNETLLVAAKKSNAEKLPKDLDRGLPVYIVGYCLGWHLIDTSVKGSLDRIINYYHLEETKK